VDGAFDPAALSSEQMQRAWEYVQEMFGGKIAKINEDGLEAVGGKRVEIRDSTAITGQSWYTIWYLGDLMPGKDIAIDPDKSLPGYPTKEEARAWLVGKV
jgi:hypothetical protein